jgi:hypothetical protein
MRRQLAAYVAIAMMAAACLPSFGRTPLASAPRTDPYKAEGKYRRGRAERKAARPRWRQ